MLRICLLWALLLAPAFALENQLRDHPSPYLAMHGDDPVAWQDWGEAALAQAREQDKLVFVSSGYFSCHWCHVMQRESYKNPQIAALLNEHFIPVKLDRELHPALDAYLIDYLERTQGQAGWPLNIFLTPEGYPLIGATYVPPDRFEQLLEKLNATWENERSRTRNLARRALLQVIANKAQGGFEPMPLGELRLSFLRQALSIGDPMEGGFGDQNKFPMSPQLLAMLELRGEQASPALDTLLQVTLDQMASQGLRDQLGGGFYRYTVDPSWHVPHFEKMLYTQAQLARVYLLAGRLYQRDDYLAVARDTLDFALREMRGQDGLLIASFSAVDEQGEEGGPYLWHEQQLLEVLGAEDARLAQRHWSMQGPPTLESGHLPRQGESVEQLAAGAEMTAPEMRQRLADIRGRLLQARAKRDLPADTKELAGWNGLMIGALAIAAQQLQEPRYADAALSLAKNLRERLWQGGELWRARAGDKPVGAASLQDYGFVAEGLARLLQVRDDAQLRAWQRQLLGSAWQRFFSDAGWRVSEQSLIPGMGDKPAEGDGALLAPSAMLMRASLGSADPAIAGQLGKALALSRRPVQEEPFWHASHLLVLREAAQ